MSLLKALSPLDGRYYEKTKQLGAYFSEFGLIFYRLKAEINWLIFLCNTVKLPGTRLLKKNEVAALEKLISEFSEKDAARVKTIESTTNHDVKALEYFIKESLPPTCKDIAEFVHFGCTSEDINNTAYNLMSLDFLMHEYLPVMRSLIKQLYGMAKEHKGLPMLALTHGQSASPTTVGKEFINVVVRLEMQLRTVKNVRFTAKWSGAVGNFNAHVSAYRDLDWPTISAQFIKTLGLVPYLYTTQIEPHDSFAELFDAQKRINTILIDFCRDMWMYISRGVFKQRTKEGEVGSSTMPHKVNPIDFENAEGNLGLANALYSHFSEKLPISRMQRDLSDSTVLRNLGVAHGYTTLAIQSLAKGLGKIEVNKEKLALELDSNWEVLAEPIQTVLRKNGVSGAYEKLKELSRGKKVTQETTTAFLKQLKLPPDDKKYLLELTPADYTGLAEKLVDSYKLDNTL